MGKLSFCCENRAIRNEHRIRHDRSPGIDGLGWRTESGETTRLISQRQPDRIHDQREDDEVKSIVESQHDRSVGIDGLDWLDECGENTGMISLRHPDRIQIQRKDFEMKSILKSRSLSNTEMSNKPIQLTPVRPGALLALRLLEQARVPEASRCS